MLDFNPYQYGSTEYYKCEMETEKRRLDLIIAGAKHTIIDDGCADDSEFIGICETVAVASDRYESAVKRYKEAKEKLNSHE